MTKRDLKLIAATTTAIGTLLTVMGKLFGPVEVVWNKAPWYGNLSEKLGWLMLLIAPLVYIALDWQSLFPKNSNKNDGENASSR